MEKLKPCPFCGKQPRLYKKIRLAERREYGDIEITWNIRCTCCIAGTHDRNTYYTVSDDQELKMVIDKFCPEESDGKQQVVDMWNNRSQGER